MAMQKAKTHKHQHVVPASYLSAWCDTKKLPKETDFVWRFTPAGELIGRKSPENLFTETDFYTIPMPDGSRNLTLEHGLAQLESDFTVIREKLGKHELLSPRDVIALLAFIMAMRFRTKAKRNHQAGQWGKLFDLADSMRKQFTDGRPVIWFEKLPPREDAWENTPRGKAALERKRARKDKLRGIPQGC